MPMSKGAPLKALFVVAAIWIAARVIWESLSPHPTVPSAIAAEIDEGLPQSKRASVSATRTPLSRNHTTKIKAIIGPKNDFVEPRVSVRQSGFVMSDGIKKSPKQSLPLVTAAERLKSVAARVVTSAKSPLPLWDPKTAIGLSTPSKRLSGYFWVFARQDAGTARSGPSVQMLQSPHGQYGGSQAGAILTYRVTGERQHSLSAFMRASTALSASGEEELAIGMRAQPFTKLPLSVFAEQRVGAAKWNNRGRSIYVAGGTGPSVLTADIRLETYGQAGFVFSDEGSYFFDGSATLQRDIWARDDFKITAGAGIWAGGQEGVRRLDIGPRANVHVPVGETELRFSLDWRQRVGGNAIPDSGAALTVTTGF